MKFLFGFFFFMYVVPLAILLAGLLEGAFGLPPGAHLTVAADTVICDTPWHPGVTPYTREFDSLNRVLNTLKIRYNTKPKSRPDKFLLRRKLDSIKALEEYVD